MCESSSILYHSNAFPFSDKANNFLMTPSLIKPEILNNSQSSVSFKKMNTRIDCPILTIIPNYFNYPKWYLERDTFSRWRRLLYHRCGKAAFPKQRTKSAVFHKYN